MADKLACVGRIVILQSGPGTNDRVRISDVRRYTKEEWGDEALRRMILELGAGLLPDASNACERMQVYKDLYDPDQCLEGFVAMRFEWTGDVRDPRLGEA